MEVVFYRAPKGNFGDDINEILWRYVLPKKVFDSDRLVLIGIGSILNNEHVGRYVSDRRQVVVLGSGTAYGAPPRDLSRWLVKAVRGPITAALVGRPEASVTDGAALLAIVPELVGPERDRSKILFIPHHGSLAAGRWSQVAAKCGFDFVSPQLSVPEVLAKFSEAKLVVTEAMHGAIIADTLRIPWIPAIASPAIDEFKWRDWTRSLELSFKPRRLLPSSAPEMVRHHRLRRRYQAVGVDGFERLERVDHSQGYSDHLEAREAVFRNGRRPWISRGVDLSKRGVLAMFEDAILQRSADALGAAARTTPFLSDDRVFRDRLNRLQEAAGSLEMLA